MLLRTSAALLTTLLQCFVLWLALSLSVKLAQHCDASIHHHHGAAFGLLIYYLFLFTAALIAFINVSGAIINRKWFTWAVIVFSIVVLLMLFGGSLSVVPWRMLFLAVVIVPLLGVTAAVNNFFSRLLVRITRKVRTKA
jgi:hypothetical protein